MARERLIGLGVLVGLTVLGAVGLVSLLLTGAEPRGRWGYVAGTAVFVLSVCQTAPALAFATRLGRGYWGATLRRIADTLALGGLITAPMLLILLAQLPHWLGRPSIWFDWPGAPWLWDGLAIVSLTLAGVALAYFTTWPNRSTTRWRGGVRQWTVLTRALLLLGALYCMLLVFVHLLLASDLALSLVPGWHSAVIPPYQVVSSFQGAVALVVVVFMLARRRSTSFAQEPDPLHACAKLLLALGLLWFYFIWCEFLTYWYGRTPDEQSLLSLFMFGPGAGLFTISVVCEFVVPVVVLVWNAARTSARATTFVAAVVLVGSYVDRLRVYVGAWSVATQAPQEHLPEELAALPLPGVAEIATSVGMLAAVALVVVLVWQRYGAIARWEVQAVQRLMPHRRLLRSRVLVVGRPS